MDGWMDTVQDSPKPGESQGRVDATHDAPSSNPFVSISVSSCASHGCGAASVLSGLTVKAEAAEAGVIGLHGVIFTFIVMVVVRAGSPLLRSLRRREQPKSLSRR